jgi:hypothetical protein
MIEKPRSLRRKPRFLCRTYEVSHLTHLCHFTTGIPKVWGSPKGPSGSEASMVSQHSIPSLVDTIVMLMQSLVDTSFPLGVDASFHLVVSHPVQPMVLSMQSSTDTSPMFSGNVSLDLVVSHIVQPMVVSMQSSTNNTPIFGGDASLDLVVSHIVQPIVVLMQSSTDNTHVFWGDAPLDLVFLHHIQPMVEEVIISMKSLINPTLLFESDKSKEAVTPMQLFGRSHSSGSGSGSIPYMPCPWHF